MVKENLDSVRQRICDACSRAGRKPEDVTLISVSKTKPLEMLKEAYDAGSRDFGENKVQELDEKYGSMPEDVRWHMIGHLQRNKVKYLIGKTTLIHSVDSLRLAEEINRLSVKHGVVTDILIEVNVAAEETKFGVSLDETEALIRKTAVLPGIRICGLMTIAPYVDDPEENRNVFRALRKLSVDIAAKNIDNVNMSFLSMGMTGDFEVAIEEGATHVRVGTGIFGERNYSLS